MKHAYRIVLLLSKPLSLFLLILFSGSLSWAQPSNDGCANPVVLTNLNNWCSAAGQYTNVASTPSGFGAPACWGSTNNEVWFQFTAIASAVDITINGNTGGLGTLNQPQVAVYSGACAAVLSLQVCASAPAGVNTVTAYTPNLTAGVTYLIRVDGVNANTGTFQLCINNYDSYDGCETPYVLNNLNNWCSSSAQFTNVGATPSGFGPATCWSSTDADVWFQFTAVAPSVDITINGNTGTGGTLNQPQVALYTGTCAAVISQQACGQAAPGVNTISIYKGGLTVGVTYLIRVDGFNTNQGTFQVCINNYIPPTLPGADCATATYLCNKNTVFNPGPVGAGSDANESAGSCLAAGATGGDIETNSSWYTWTCATAGSLTFDITPGVASDDLDWALFQLTGGNCATKTVLRCVASSCPGATGINSTAADISEPFDCTPVQDNYVSQVNMTAGTTYGLLINNFTSTAQGFTIDFGGTGTFTGPTSSFTANPTTACVGSSVTFTSTSTGALSYNWNFGANATPATANTVGPHNVTYSTAGTKTITLTVTGPGGCQVLSSQTITINAPTIPAFAALSSVCQGSTAPTLPTTSTNGINGSWAPAVSTASAGTFTYTFTPTAGQCATTASNSLTVNAPTTPTFNAVAPVCQGSTAPTLPTTSTNGINGSWAPAVSTASVGTSTYTFTPTAGQCASTTTINVTVNAPTNPTFNPVSPACQGSTPPTLPTTSTNGINGSWAPAVSTASAGASTYTFTPAAGQCASTTTISVTVNAPTNPTFNPVASVCQGATPPTLPTTSTNGINGSWAPAASTASAGTFTHTFTPTAGQCASTTTLSFTVTAPTTPTFTAPSAVCQGDPAPTLSTTSNNGINGSWAPAVSTASAGTFSYTFTPAAGQCATTATTSLTVNAPIAPAFTALSPVCQGDPAPTLPTTSNNGVTGSWAPAASTSTAGTFTYTFTPGGSQCATTASLSLTVNAPTVPTFNPIAPVCEDDPAPAFPTTSTNGINGSWAPAVSTANAGTTTYTFTPAGGQCASTTTINFTVGPPSAPTFTQVPPQCQGDPAPTLPTTSNEGFTGGWSPAVSTASAGTTSYTFTPSAGQCATDATMDIVVNPQTIPSFGVIAPVCQNDTPPTLPTTSNNGINGSWAPAVSTASAGTTTYTFTPAAGQCAATTTADITVGPPATPTFTALSDVCEGEAAPTLPTTSNNGITGSWNPAPDSSVPGTSTHTFTPDAGQCATTTTLSLTVNPIPVVSVPSLSTCPGVPIVLNASGADTYTWSPTTNLSASTGSSVTANPPATETYTINGTTNGCTGTTTATVTVAGALTISVSPSAPTLCSGSSVTLTATGADNYTWSPGTGLSSTTGTSVDANPTSTITYTVDGNTSGCMGSTTVTVTINTPVAPAFTPLSDVCQGDPAPTLPSTSNNGVPGTWSSAISTASAGTFSYTFTPDPGECATTASLSLTVNSPTTPNFPVIAPVCQNDPAPSLAGTSTNGVSGSWSPSVSTSAPGTTVYTFTPNAGQCAETTTNSITVNALPVVDVPSVSTCADVPITLNATGADTYSWSPPGTLSATTGSSVTCTTSSTVTINCTGTTAGCSTSTTATVTVASGLSITVNPSNPAICSGSSVQLTGSGATNYTWTPSSGGPVLSGNPVDISPASTETYTVDGNTSGCTGSTSVTITVNTPVTPTFAALSPVCQNDPAPVLPSTSSEGIPGSWSPAVSTASAGTYSYTFTPANGECATTAGNSLTVNAPVTPTFATLTPQCQGTAAPSLPVNSNEGFSGTWSGTPNTSGPGMQNFTFTPASGQCATNASTSFTVYGLPSVVAGSDQTACEGTPLTVAGSGASNYAWNNGVSDGIPFTQNPGAMTYTVTGTDGNGCQNTDQVVITVTSAPTITANASQSAVCYGESIVFSGSGGSTYSWDNGVVNGVPHTQTSPGTVTYNVTGTDAGGCQGNDAVTITVFALPLVDGGPDQTACPEDEITLSAGGAVSYTWTGATDNVPFTPVATQVYTVTGTDANGCQNSDQVLVTVSNPPQADFGVKESELTVTDPTVVIVNNSTGAATYFWNFGDGSQPNTEVDPTYTYDGSIATYTITLTAYSSGGCADQTSQKVMVRDEFIFWIPNSFTPNGDELNNTFKPVVTSGFDPYNFSFYLFNRWGEIIFESHDATVGWDGTYQGQLADEGIYTWQIKMKDPETDRKYEYTGSVNLFR